MRKYHKVPTISNMTPTIEPTTAGTITFVVWLDDELLLDVSGVEVGNATGVVVTGFDAAFVACGNIVVRTSAIPPLVEYIAQHCAPMTEAKLGSMTIDAGSPTMVVCCQHSASVVWPDGGAVVLSAAGVSTPNVCAITAAGEEASSISTDAQAILAACLPKLPLVGVAMIRAVHGQFVVYSTITASDKGDEKRKVSRCANLRYIRGAWAVRARGAKGVCEQRPATSRLMPWCGRLLPVTRGQSGW